MPAAFLMAPLLLASVLVVSGVAKLRDPNSLRVGMESLRVPDQFRTPAVRLVVPWLEVGLGVLLVLAPWPLNMLAAFGALVLMAVYAVLIWQALGRDEAADCNCFGSAAPSKVTGLTLARNVTLVLLAAFSMLDAVAGPVIARLYTTDALWWILSFVAALWLAYTIWGDRLLPADEPIEAGPVERVSLTSPGGQSGTGIEESEVEELDYERLPIPFGTLKDGDETVTLRSLARKHAVLLVWVSTTCGACSKVAPELPKWRDDLAGIVDVRPVVAKLDGLDELQPGLSEYALVDPQYQTEELFDAFGVPAAVLLGADGRLAGGPVTGHDGIRGLVSDMKAQLEEARVERVPGEPETAGATVAHPGETGPGSENLAGATRPDEVVLAERDDRKDGHAEGDLEQPQP